MATLVFHQGVYSEEDKSSNGHRRESNCYCESSFPSYSRRGANSDIQWLPNQLQAVLDLMKEIHEKHNELPGCKDLMDVALLQRKTLRKEVDKYCRDRNVSAR